MSTLTKVCVVVLVLLVLVASPVFIQKSVVDYNWRKAYDDQKQRAELAAVQAGNQELAASVWKKYYEEARLSAEYLAQQIQNTIAEKDTRINELSQVQAANSTKLSELNASVQGLQKDLEGQIALNKTLTGQLDQQRDQNTKLSDQIRQAQDVIRERMANVDILTKSALALQEQLAMLKKENQELRDRLEAGGIKAPVAPTVKAPKIEGAVTAVQKDLASLNVGSADGVQKGMEFTIYRGADFVAHLRIAEVYASSCAGVIADAQRDVRLGDKAATVLE